MRAPAHTLTLAARVGLGALVSLGAPAVAAPPTPAATPPSPPPAPSAQAPLPDPIEGRWSYFNEHVTTLGPAGTVASDRGQRGRWTVEDAAERKYRVAWDGGRWVDHLQLSPDGQRLRGVNSMGNTAEAVRVGSARATGRYVSADGTRLQLLADGKLVSSSGATGRWTLVEADGAHRLDWADGQRELVTLTPDSLALMSGGKPRAYRSSVPLAGRWLWPQGREVVVRVDGTLGHPDVQRGSGGWALLDATSRRYRVWWGTRTVEDLTLSEAGDLLVGTNGAGQAVRALRLLDPIVGEWSWTDGTRATLRLDGTADGDAPGTWLVIDAHARRYGVAWGGRVEDVVLSADGRQLEGKDTAGQPVRATRR